MNTIFRPQNLISSKKIKINDFLNIVAYSFFPPREYSRGAD